MIFRIIFFLCLVNSLYGQEFGKEFGRVTQEEIELASYTRDTAANALVLFDIGKTKFMDDDGGYKIRFERTRRVKIFRGNAEDEAEVTIPFYVDGYGKTEIIESIEAFTYNYEDARASKQPLDPSTVYEEKLSRHWSAKKFVLPDVKAGSIIEYKYVLESPFHFNLPDWTFQDEIPTLHSEYEVSMIPFYEYVYLVQGVDAFDAQESQLAQRKRKHIGSGVEFQDYTHRYVLRDVPAFIDEGYITSPEDFLIKMDFQLARFHHPYGGTQEIVTTWPAMNKALLKHEKFGKYIKGCERAAKKILDKELDINHLAPADRAQAIIDHVKASFTWDEYRGKYASKSPRDLINQKNGNSADINLFLIALLRAAGLQADPVILSTRRHGKVHQEHPFDHFFNYVIALVEEGPMFLADATAPHLAHNRIPPRCINDKGLVVREGEVKWLNLYNDLVSSIERQLTVHVDPESATARIAATVLLTEYEAYKYRQAFEDDTTELKEAFSNETFSDVANIKTRNFDQPAKPYAIQFQAKADVEKVGNNLIIAPFQHLVSREPIFQQKRRTHPIDFIYSGRKKFRVSVKIPDGYRVIHLPESHEHNDEMAKISLTYRADEQHLFVEGEYVFHRSMYRASAYGRLKTCFELIAQKFNEEIVLQS